MARSEVAFRGTKLVGVEIDAKGVLVAEDATNGVDAGDLQATIVALAARIKALENPG